MLILAIDSSGMTASAALVTGEKVMAEMSVNNKKTHSQTLLPMIRDVFEAAGVQPEEIDAVAVAEGPGSFTGLRIGAALAKGLGLSLDKPLIGIPTMDAMAYGTGICDGLICPMIDARHETVYTGRYRWEGGRFETVISTEAVNVREIAGQIREAAGDSNDCRILICGDGAAAYGSLFKECLEEPGIEAVTVPVHQMSQRAAAVGALALLYAAEGKEISADDFKPRYYRLTQAERERMKKLRTEGRA